MATIMTSNLQPAWIPGLQFSPKGKYQESISTVSLLHIRMESDLNNNKSPTLQIKSAKNSKKQKCPQNETRSLFPLGAGEGTLGQLEDVSLCNINS